MNVSRIVVLLFLAAVGLQRLLETFARRQTIAGQSWFDTERVYNHGYAFGLYLKERFGEDIYTRVAELSDQGWRSFTWLGLFEDLTGVPAPVSEATMN